MRLRLELAEGAIEHPNGASGFAVEMPSTPWLRIEIGPLVVAPTDRPSWLRRLLEPDEPNGSIRVLGSTVATTTRGWPLEVIDALVGEGSRVIERRLVATFDMLGHVAAILMRTSDSEYFACHVQSVVMPIAASAWPDWRTASAFGGNRRTLDRR